VLYPIRKSGGAVYSSKQGLWMLICNTFGLLQTKAATEEFMKKYILLLSTVCVLPPFVSEAAQVIELTQAGCQFLEAEGTDHKFATHSYAVTLKEDECRYSCPLNPTPDYTLIVK
jgi:hypothetical protein